MKKKVVGVFVVGLPESIPIPPSQILSVLAEAERLSFVDSSQEQSQSSIQMMTNNNNNSENNENLNENCSIEILLTVSQDITGNLKLSAYTSSTSATSLTELPTQNIKFSSSNYLKNCQIESICLRDVKKSGTDEFKSFLSGQINALSLLLNCIEDKEKEKENNSSLEWKSNILSQLSCLSHDENNGANQEDYLVNRLKADCEISLSTNQMSNLLDKLLKIQQFEQIQLLNLQKEKEKEKRSGMMYGGEGGGGGGRQHPMDVDFYYRPE